MIEFIGIVLIVLWMCAITNRLHKQNKLTQTLIDEVIKRL